MDNMTHSLVGAAIAQAAIQYRMQRAERVQADAASALEAPAIAATPMVVTSVLANNFPDLDLIVTLFTDPKLGYILHHRGHTHTLMFVPILVLLLLSGAWLFSRWKSTQWSREDWWWIVGLAALGGCVHLGMDSWNVYGIHPFWPLDNRWMYGDFVFIVEPLIWFSLIPWLISCVERRWLRNLLFFAYGLGIVALFALYFKVIWFPLVVVFLALLFGYLVRYKVRPIARSWMSFVALICVLFGLLTGSMKARSSIVASVRVAAPQESLLDIAMMSYPSNPMCFEFLTMGYNFKDRSYIVRQGVFSLFPKSMKCPVLRQGRTVKVQPVQKKLRPLLGGFIGSVKVFRRPVKELRELAATHCQVKAALQFIRIPYWYQNKKIVQIGDMRFDHTKDLELAEFIFKRKPKTCPTLLPPWVPPVKSRNLIP